jgi:ribokinase
LKAVCIGGAMVDSIATIESDRIERMSMLNAETSYLLLEEGGKTEAVDISTHCGGGAINAAVALARLGFDVSPILKLGRDTRAEFIISRLGSEGISTRWVARDAEAPTGSSVIISSHERNAAVFTFRGANELLTEDDIPAEASAVDLVYISGLSGNSADRFPQIVGKASAAGALVAVSASARQLSAHANAMLDSLAKIGIFALNRREAEALLPTLITKLGGSKPRPEIKAGEHLPALLTRGLSASGQEISLPDFFAALHSLGARHIMLTDGSNGAFVGTRDAILYCPAQKASVASTAGAGDAMAATFAAFIAMDYPANAALNAAALNAASVVTFSDTQSGLLRRDALETHLKAHPDFKLRQWKL